MSKETKKVQLNKLFCCFSSTKKIQKEKIFSPKSATNQKPCYINKKLHRSMLNADSGCKNPIQTTEESDVIAEPSLQVEKNTNLSGFSIGDLCFIAECMNEARKPKSLTKLESLSRSSSGKHSSNKSEGSPMKKSKRYKNGSVSTKSSSLSKSSLRNNERDLSKLSSVSSSYTSVNAEEKVVENTLSEDSSSATLPSMSKSVSKSVSKSSVDTSTAISSIKSDESSSRSNSKSSSTDSFNIYDALEAISEKGESNIELPVIDSHKEELESKQSSFHTSTSKIVKSPQELHNASKHSVSSGDTSVKAVEAEREKTNSPKPSQSLLYILKDLCNTKNEKSLLSLKESKNLQSLSLDLNQNKTTEKVPNIEKNDSLGKKHDSILDKPESLVKLREYLTSLSRPSETSMEVSVHSNSMLNRASSSEYSKTNFELPTNETKSFHRSDEEPSDTKDHAKITKELEPYTPSQTEASRILKEPESIFARPALVNESTNRIQVIHRQEMEANMNKEEKISEANVDAESIQNTKEAVKKKSKFSLKPIKKKRSASKSLNNLLEKDSIPNNSSLIFNWKSLQNFGQGTSKSKIKQESEPPMPSNTHLPWTLDQNLNEILGQETQKNVDQINEKKLLTEGETSERSNWFKDKNVSAKKKSGNKI